MIQFIWNTCTDQLIANKLVLILLREKKLSICKQVQGIAK